MINVPQITSVFRRDINGLRAWAVAAVIIYHFGITGFGGGFVGVDVFFVISGFLMTGIVVGGLELAQGNASGFSLLAFYGARARRILPALIVLCGVLLALGWWTLLPVDYKALGTHSVASLAFISNIVFWREAGYFDAASLEKWLLHTWSLSVEWQFYLLLPLALLGVWKWRPGRKAITAFMLAGFVASLALSVVATPLKPALAFYLLPTRAWEMLAGGLVYLLAHRLKLNPRRRRWLEAVGLGLIMASVAGFDATVNWPGWRALVPVLGAALVLMAARSDSLWTGHPVAQWLGARSYSLYLWHWPIVVALAYQERQADPLALGAGLLLTLVLGHLSYRWVELPARLQLGKRQRPWGAAVLVCGALLVAVPAIAVHLKEGVAGRFSPAIEQVALEGDNKKPRRDVCFTKGGTESASCLYGGKQLRAILIGDSHADAVTTALAAAAPNASDAVMDWSYVKCLTTFGVKDSKPRANPNEKCAEFLAWAALKLNDVPHDIPLVIVNRTTMYAIGNNAHWENTANAPLVYFSDPSVFATPGFLAEFSQHLTDTACQLAKTRPVYLVRPIPEMGVDVPKVLARALLVGRDKEVSISLADYHRRHAVVWAAQDAAHARCGVTILDPLPYLCRDGRCQGAQNGRPLYYDDNHLSEFGNKLLVPMFAAVFKKI